MPQIPPAHFTPRMAALLDAALPDSRATARSRFLGDVLGAVENRSTLSSQHYAKAEQWGMQGTFGKAYAALHPHAAQLDHDERVQLWSLKGLHEVYRSGTAPTFERAVEGLGLWKVGNVARMKTELLSPMAAPDASDDTSGAASVHTDEVQSMELAEPEPAIDDLEADLFRELGFSDIPGLAAGYGSPTHRMHMAQHLARACRQIGLESVTNVNRFFEVKTQGDREARVVVGAWHASEPQRRAYVDIDRMLVPARPTPDLIPAHVLQATVDSPATTFSPNAVPDLLRDL